MDKIVDKYCLMTLSETIKVTHLVTVHYFEYSKNYIFEGEKHNFWELLFVDKGEINAIAGRRKYALKQGEMIFHKPNEWHNVIANGKVAPNLIVIAFDCQSKAMDFFNEKVLVVDDKVKEYLGCIVTEAVKIFSSSLDDPSLKVYQKRKEMPFASEQLIKIYLELILIHIVRTQHNEKSVLEATVPILEYANEEKVNIIIHLLKENVCSQLTLNDICKATLLSKSSIQKLFKDNMQMSVLEYFKQLKIGEAKRLIREENLNFTQIARRLNYSSIHYFSRIFKSTTNMTLTEYSLSVKRLIKPAQ